jgi:hypothetical protein
MRNIFYPLSDSLGFFVVVLAVILPASVVSRESSVSNSTTQGEGISQNIQTTFYAILYGSGIKGTTSSMVVSGVQGGETTGGPASMEFAIAPIENTTLTYSKAIFVRSDNQGKFKITLPPGKYWIGPKAKALDPVHYVPGTVLFSEEVVVVEEGVFTQVDLSEVGYAP